MSLTYIGYSKAIISAPGDYTIDRDITCSSPNDAAIYINPGVHHVKLHIRSRIECTAGKGNISTGIEANGSAGVQIMGEGGLLRGFRFSARLSNCYLARVKDLFIQDGTFRGIVIEGDDAYVEGCDVRTIGGSTHPASTLTAGIEVSGNNPTVIRNKVEGVVSATYEALGISITDLGQSGLVAYNAMLNDVRAGMLPNGNHGSYGLWVGGNSNVHAKFNIVSGWSCGMAYSSPTSGRVESNDFENCTVDTLLGANVQLGANN